MYNIEEIILGMANIVNEKKKLEETVSELQNRIYELECQIKNLSNSKYIGSSQSEVTMSMYKKDKTENGYRICKDDNTNIHTHIKNLNPSYKLIDNVVNHKIPTRCGLYYLESHIRLTDNEDYKRKLQEYYDVKVNKGRKQEYFNPGIKKSF